MLKSPRYRYEIFRSKSAEKVHTITEHQPVIRAFKALLSP